MIVWPLKVTAAMFMRVLRQIASYFMTLRRISARSHRNWVFRFIGPSTPRWNLFLFRFLLGSDCCCLCHSCMIWYLICSIPALYPKSLELLWKGESFKLESQNIGYFIHGLLIQSRYPIYFVVNFFHNPHENEKICPIKNNSWCVLLFNVVHNFKFRLAEKIPISEKKGEFWFSSFILI